MNKEKNSIFTYCISTNRTNMEEKERTKLPAPFKWCLLISCLPIFVWPFMMLGFEANEYTTDNWLLLILYPIYALLSVYLAYNCYAQRRGLAWIILALTWLAFGAECMLL